MTPDEVLKHEPKILSDEQRRFYFDNGYLLVSQSRVMVRDHAPVLLERFVSSQLLALGFSHSPDGRPCLARCHRLVGCL